MPGPIIAAEAGDKMGARISGAHAWCLALFVAAAGLLIFWGVRQSAGGGPKVPAADSEDVPPFVPPPSAPLCGPDQHVGGYVFTPHRYPRAVGMELSAVINHGHATLKIPHAKDMTWLTRPPSEVTL